MTSRPLHDETPAAGSAPAPALDLTVSASQLAEQLVDVPSVSGSEGALADAIELAMRGVPHLNVFRDGDAVVARTELGQDRRVILAGHIDTVPINANVPGVVEQRDDGRWLVGRGAVDMKGGLAVVLSLGARVPEPSFDLTIIAYDHEEVSAKLNGLGRLVRNHPDWVRGDFAILGEPTSGRVEGGCNGSCRFLVTARGRRAHSARSWTGENAIHAAAPILDFLATFQPRTVSVDGLDYREGLNAVGISGGVAGNVIPDACSVHVNYRFAPSLSPAEAERNVRDWFHGYEIEFLDMSPGARPGLDSKLPAAFLNAIGGTALPKYGWTDVARFSELGIPAVNFGPGNALLAHADDEAVREAEIDECYDRLRHWLQS